MAAPSGRRAPCGKRSSPRDGSELAAPCIQNAIQADSSIQREERASARLAGAPQLAGSGQPVDYCAAREAPVAADLPTRKLTPPSEVAEGLLIDLQQVRELFGRQHFP